jgi:hypothetical protein
MNYEGYLEKKGRGKKNILRPWTKRYFTLDISSRTLTYYKNNSKNNKKGSIVLGKGLVALSKQTEKPFMFEVQLEGETLVLAAQDLASRSVWMGHIDSCLEHTNISKDDIDSKETKPDSEISYLIKEIPLFGKLSALLCNVAYEIIATEVYRI